VTDDTKVKFSYEHFHDNRTADRGNPSQALNATAPSSTRFNPASPFAPNGDLTAFFGSPALNQAIANVQTGMAFVEHDFHNGLTVKNGTFVADYQKFHQNVYPGNGALSGAVNPADTSFNYAAYQHKTNRDSVFDQTDFTYKVVTGPAFHTLGFGTELEVNPASTDAIPAYFPTARIPRSAIRSRRPTSGPSTLSTRCRAHSLPASRRRIRIASITHLSSQRM
jgi:catecholate siderophore receptor